MGTAGPVPPLVIALIIIVTNLGVGVYLVHWRGFPVAGAAFVVVPSTTLLFLLWWLTMRYLRQKGLET